jgi:YesN/AraC family two-component response regulator
MAERGGAITLVIVDDNAGIRTLLRALAKRDERIEVVGEAAHGGEAIELARKYQPHVMILDVMMPVMDGLEAIPGVLEASPATRIVMYSAYAESREEAMRRGAHGWCLKGEPWDAMADVIFEQMALADGPGGDGG